MGRLRRGLFDRCSNTGLECVCHQRNLMDSLCADRESFEKGGYEVISLLCRREEQKLGALDPMLCTISS